MALFGTPSVIRFNDKGTSIGHSQILLDNSVIANIATTRNITTSQFSDITTTDANVTTDSAYQLFNTLVNGTPVSYINFDSVVCSPGTSGADYDALATVSIVSGFASTDLNALYNWDSLVFQWTTAQAGNLQPANALYFSLGQLNIDPSYSYNNASTYADTRFDSVINSFTAPVNGDVWRIEVTPGQVVWRVNGSIVRTEARTVQYSVTSTSGCAVLSNTSVQSAATESVVLDMTTCPVGEIATVTATYSGGRVATSSYIKIENPFPTCKKITRVTLACPEDPKDIHLGFEPVCVSRTETTPASYTCFQFDPAPLNNGDGIDGIEINGVQYYPFPTVSNDAEEITAYILAVGSCPLHSFQTKNLWLFAGCTGELTSIRIHKFSTNTWLNPISVTTTATPCPDIDLSGGEFGCSPCEDVLSINRKNLQRHKWLRPDNTIFHTYTENLPNGETVVVTIDPLLDVITEGYCKIEKQVVQYEACANIAGIERNVIVRDIIDLETGEILSQTLLLNGSVVTGTIIACTTC